MRTRENGNTLFMLLMMEFLVGFFNIKKLNFIDSLDVMSTPPPLPFPEVCCSSCCLVKSLGPF